MKNSGEIGLFQMRILSNLMKRAIDSSLCDSGLEEMTGMHGWIIAYLYDHRGEDVFQRDIQERFSVRRSTVTGILQLMEKKGLIVREMVGADARLKKLTLTKRAEELHLQVQKSIDKVEQRAAQGLTESELRTFVELCEKIRKNIE